MTYSESIIKRLSLAVLMAIKLYKKLTTLQARTYTVTSLQFFVHSALKHKN